MKDKKQSVKQAMKTFYASKPLSDTQHTDLQALQKKLQQSQDGTYPNKSYMLRWIGMAAASLFLFTVTVAYMQTPTVITAAYADILHDADLNNGMKAKMHRWMNDHNIGNIPQEYLVEMSKFCTLGKYQTSHLRIAGTEQGTLHLFLHQGDRPTHWLDRTGTVDELNWSLIKIRDDLTVIVMSTHDMRESAIQYILSGILADPKFYTFNWLE